MHTSLATYQVFLTRNSEYHLQSHVCVGVRDRRTGRWMDEHPALQRPLSTTIRTAGQWAPLQKPQLGESLEFDLDGSPLRTSPVLNIEERGNSSQRAVMAPRSNVSAGSALAVTFPSAPLPVSSGKAPSSGVKTSSATPAPAPKPAASAGHKAVKSARWLFRRRKRSSTAERNVAQAQEARATSTVTTRATVNATSERAEDQRLARTR
jgi:hypothetical protein